MCRLDNVLAGLGNCELPVILTRRCEMAFAVCTSHLSPISSLQQPSTFPTNFKEDAEDFVQKEMEHLAYSRSEQEKCLFRCIFFTGSMWNIGFSTSVDYGVLYVVCKCKKRIQHFHYL